VLDQIEVAGGDPEPLGHASLGQTVLPPQRPDLSTESRAILHDLNLRPLQLDSKALTRQIALNAYA